VTPSSRFPEDKREAIGKRLRRLRKTRKLSAVQVAIAADIKSPSHYSCLERGKFSPTRATLGRLAKVLGVSLEYLETGRNGKTGNGGAGK
jgi:transcriptional regulator with XRE-family HTH domain